MEVKWIKITTTMFDDEKIRIIESMPEADALLVIWIKLLTLTGKTNSHGYIFLSENIPYTDEMLSTILGRPLNTVRLALQTFKQFKMIDFDDQGYLYLVNWEKHQNVDGLDRIREQTRQRVAKHRETQRAITTANCNATVTQRNATEIDKNKSKNKNIYISKFDEFWTAYPRKVSKQNAVKAWGKIEWDETLFEKIMTGLAKAKRSKEWAKDDGEFIPHAATWLNGKRWEDEIIISVGKPKQKPKATDGLSPGEIIHGKNEFYVPPEILEELQKEG